MIDYNQLAEAARYNDAIAEDTHDVAKVLSDLGVDPDSAFRAAEQRAIRLHAMSTGRLAELQSSGGIDLSPAEQQVVNAYIMAAVDGMAIALRSKAIEAREDG